MFVCCQSMQLHEQPLHMRRSWCGVLFMSNATWALLFHWWQRRQDNSQCWVVFENNVHLLAWWDGVAVGTWFRQDTAVPHKVHISMMVLENLFPDYLVLNFVDVGFPARSLNLTATDFFVWACFKSVVQGSAEIPNDLVTQLWVESLAWGICPWAPF